MTEHDIKAIKSLLLAPKHIVIVPHKNPDGDAMGSTLGLYHFLTKNNHKATVIAPNDYPDFLKWLPGHEHVIIHESDKINAEALIEQADIIFTLDFNAFHRSGQMEQHLENSKALKIMIDHHQQPDGYATYMYSDVTMSSTCEMVYHFINKLDAGEDIDTNIATCLYAGILTDTGSFRFPSSTSTTHIVAADLIDKGADHSEIYNAIYDTNSFERLQLLGVALKNLKILPEYRTAYITLTQEELNAANFRKGDTEGFVNYGLSIKDIVFAAIFIEHKQEGIIKISLRSKGDFSVNEFSRENFGGGGHTNAAGGKSDLGLNETVEKFISILPRYKHNLNL
ncbi:bifunctional oligoribonuclease/PAP phosphatase NrnA [uncultured Gelidibacter sp.]|uniref:DHH family phosphoesterase n=1 Tax=uncultured Gelidibacter sp. TaxID=259318 RepID=UPI002610A731|nr:bifunctional oligoribonuclease/PAP phosphatase NrnA [uncultured Gelidibacter sp.]